MLLFAPHRREDQLTNAVHETVARWQFPLNVKVTVWAAARDGERYADAHTGTIHEC